ncbi:MAG: DNA-processing protein DprA [Clostridia bacterium]|nr:DNA-processing protein DprA [Clostridia bacterium]
MNKLLYWIWLSLACTPGSPTFGRLIGAFADAKDIYDASESEIRRTVGSRVSDCTALANKELGRAKEILEFCLTKKVGIVTYADENFPESLRRIPTPPVLLYYRGVLPDFKRYFGCAIVGTRSLTNYGRTNAFKLGYDMASAGATVVSGMAVGIDGVAHAGALAAGGVTVAVLGSGIDVCYPSDHVTLARGIVKNGCVMTEYAPGTKPLRYNFPCRNRLISGLCTATAVVEGREKSGSRSTAKHAEEQGRAVYAFPGNIGSETSQLTNLLIKNGARLCTGADDIVRDFERESGGVLNPFNLRVTSEVNMSEVLSEYRVSCVTSSDNIFRAPRQRREKREEKPEVKRAEQTNDSAVEELPFFDKSQLDIYKRIPRENECTIESLVCAEYSLSRVMSILLRLEMGNFIVMLPGDRVKRNI